MTLSLINFQYGQNSRQQTHLLEKNHLLATQQAARPLALWRTLQAIPQQDDPYRQQTLILNLATFKAALQQHQSSFGISLDSLAIAHIPIGNLTFVPLLQHQQDIAITHKKLHTALIKIHGSYSTYEGLTAFLKYLRTMPTYINKIDLNHSNYDIEIGILGA